MFLEKRGVLFASRHIHALNRANSPVFFRLVVFVGLYAVPRFRLPVITAGAWLGMYDLP